MRTLKCFISKEILFFRNQFSVKCDTFVIDITKFLFHLKYKTKTCSDLPDSMHSANPVGMFIKK